MNAGITGETPEVGGVGWVWRGGGSVGGEWEGGGSRGHGGAGCGGACGVSPAPWVPGTRGRDRKDARHDPRLAKRRAGGNRLLSLRGVVGGPSGGGVGVGGGSFWWGSDINVKIIAIEEHWNSAGIRDALDRLQNGARDESVAFNTMGDNQARLEDIGQGRVEAMDAAGIEVSILSVVTPATQALPAREASRWPGKRTTRSLTPSARIRPASARSRPCRPAIRRLRPQNSNGAPPSWATSAR